MPTDPFPARVTPRKLCNRNGSINSTISLGKLLRLSEYLDDNHGQAEVCLSFDRDETGYCVITGTLKADVSMPCQRCLEPTPVSLDSDLALKVAEDEDEARRIAENSDDPHGKLEIVTCEDGQLDLLAVVEDELIMSLPTVAVHDDEHCNETLNALHSRARRQEESGRGNVKGLEALEALKQAIRQEQDKDSD